MKKYTFQEWKEVKTLSESIDSDPQPGDYVITNPKAFMNSVMTKGGKLKNGGLSNLSNYSRFRINDVDGRKIQGSVSHRTFSGGHTKKFNSYDFLDVSPAFKLNGSRVWLNNAPGRRATAHYINKMYPVWAGKMGIEGHVDPDMQEIPEMEPEMSSEFEPQFQQPETQPEFEPQQQLQMPYKQVEPQMPYKQVQEPQEPQSQQAAPWEKPSQPTPSYTMHNREVVPTNNFDNQQSSGNFGFDSPDADSGYEQDSIPMADPNVGSNFDMGAPDSMGLAAHNDPMIGEGKKYKYYPEG